MRRFVVGDIHGAHRALLQVLQRSGFNHDEDMLISLGDIVDGWSESYAVVERLANYKILMGDRLVYVKGNHDQWFIDYIRTGIAPRVWTTQGGEATLNSYKVDANRVAVPLKHQRFLMAGLLYYELGDLLFVHGGVPQGLNGITPRVYGDETLLWDRSLIQAAYKSNLRGEVLNLNPYRCVFVGHTPVQHYRADEVVDFGGLIGVDTNAGWDGFLSLMDIDSDEVFTSDRCPTLYPDEKGRYG